jgi:hypothetical protein
MRRAATILNKSSATPVPDLERVLIEPESKALILALLAERFPAQRAEYAAEAARFNIRRRPPYQLVRSAIDRARP